MSTGWSVRETAAIGKRDDQDSEDRAVIGGNGDDVSIVAVIDGATAKDGALYDGRSSGHAAADAVASAVTDLRDAPTRADPIEFITRELRERWRGWRIDESRAQGPSAVAAIFFVAQRTIWRVGDVHVGMRDGGTWIQYLAEKRIDQAAADARAALLHCYLRAHHDIDDLRENDPGRAMLLPLLQIQNVLANRADRATDFEFGTLNGHHVPARFVEQIPVPDSVTEVVLASDGYLAPAPTLEQAEHDLAESLSLDPLRIGQHRSTKAVAPGANSFDDRTYIRLILRRSDDVAD